MTESVDWGQGWTQTGCLRGGGGGALQARGLNRAAQAVRGGGGGEYERDGTPPTHTHLSGVQGISPLIRGGVGDLPNH